ncbi:MAG: tetratricopeptide (TPR) repeat protein [Verrucomicrobiales bacterium]|jgi:tetratricopeptide (TPR) repeat protein
MMTTDPTRVLEMLEEANRYYERSGDRGFYRWKSQFLLGLWHVQFGDPNDSLDYADRLVDASRDIDDLLVLGHAHEVRALALESIGDHDDAKSELMAAVETYGADGFTKVCFAHCLDHTALWFIADESPHEAALAVGAAEAIRSQHADPTAPPYARNSHAHAKSSALRALGETGFDASFTRGYSMAAAEVGDAVAAELVRAD